MSASAPSPDFVCSRPMPTPEAPKRLSDAGSGLHDQKARAITPLKHSPSRSSTRAMFTSRRKVHLDRSCPPDTCRGTGAEGRRQPLCKQDIKRAQKSKGPPQGNPRRPFVQLRITALSRHPQTPSACGCATGAAASAAPSPLSAESARALPGSSAQPLPACARCRPQAQTAS